MTPAGIEPATFRFVTQRLSHCATAVPNHIITCEEFFDSRSNPAEEEGCCAQISCTRVSEMKTLNIFYLVIYCTQKLHNDFTFLCSLHCVPYNILLRGNFPSRWLQLLQWPLVSLLGVPDQVEESLLQNKCRS